MKGLKKFCSDLGACVSHLFGMALFIVALAMPNEMMAQEESVTVNPSGYSSSSNVTDLENGYTGTASTTYASIGGSAGRLFTLSAYVYYTFAFPPSSIPDDATINSVTCSVKYRVSSTSNVSSASLRLYSGNSSKSEAITTKNTREGTYTFKNAGTWNRSELEKMILRVNATIARSSNGYLYFYGADVTVTYTVPTRHNITVEQTVGGTISASVESAGEGTLVTLNNTPDDAYDFNHYEVTAGDGSSVTVSDNGTFTMPNSDVTVTGVFNKNVYARYNDKTVMLKFIGNTQSGGKFIRYAYDNGNADGQRVGITATGPTDGTITKYLFKVVKSGDGYTLQSLSNEMYLRYGVAADNVTGQTNAKKQLFTNDASKATIFNFVKSGYSPKSANKDLTVRMQGYAIQFTYAPEASGSDNGFRVMAACETTSNDFIDCLDYTSQAYNSSIYKNTEWTTDVTLEIYLDMAAFDAPHCFYATFSSDETVKFADNVYVYTIPSINGNALTLYRVTGNVVPANTGVLLKSTSEISSDISKYYALYEYAEPASAVGTNLLYPASKAKSELPNCKFYKLAYSDSSHDPSTLGFYYGAANGGEFTSRAGGAYLAIPTGQAPAKGFTFVESDVDAIEDVVAEENNGVMFNLAGQRIDAPVRGQIYIVNGKKYIAK